MFLDGNVIDLGIYKLQVAEACSGLRYLFPIMSFTYVFAVLYRGPVWHKLVLLLSAIPLAVLMNAVRIGVIGILVDRFGIGAGRGLPARLRGLGDLPRLHRHPVRHGQGDAAARRATAGRSARRSSSTSPASGHEIARVRDIEPSRALIAAACLTAALSAAWMLAPAREAAAAPSATPSPASRWRSAAGRGAAAVLEPGIECVLGADDYLAAFYRAPTRRRGSTSS